MSATMLRDRQRIRTHLPRGKKQSASPSDQVQQKIVAHQYHHVLRKKKTVAIRANHDLKKWEYQFIKNFSNNTDQLLNKFPREWPKEKQYSRIDTVTQQQVLPN